MHIDVLFVAAAGAAPMRKSVRLRGVSYRTTCDAILVQFTQPKADSRDLAVDVARKSGVVSSMT